MKNTKKNALTGIFAALYFVLSLSLKFPLVGNISLDLGYLALIVAAVVLGSVPAALVGAIGAAVESILLSPFGLSIGWVVMNFAVGLIVGWSCKNYKAQKHSTIIAVVSIIIAVFVGVSLKTGIECTLYSIPLIVKLPKSLTAFIVDSGVMIAGLPLANMIYKRK